MKIKLVLILSLLFLFSCVEYEVNTIGNNNPPIDRTITSERKVNFVNRLFITLVGKKPSNEELANALSQLNVDPHSIIVRRALVNSVMNKAAYYPKTWEDARGDLLDGIDTVTIRNEYNKAVANYASSTGNTKYYWHDQMIRLETLLDIPQELESSIIDMPIMHHRACNNPIYDDINMGTENFVVAVFQQFCHRYPTNSELVQGKKMVDGQQGVLFLQSGSTKTDFLNIILTSTSYYEGQVIYVFQKYLFRNPTTQELADLTQLYEGNKDYKYLQQEILASDEYLFF